MGALEKNVEKILSFLTLVVILFIFIYVFRNSDLHEVSWIEDKVDLKINEKSYDEVYIDKTSLPPVYAGDVVTITKKNFKISDNNESLVFRTYGAALDVFLGEKNIYTYGNDLYDADKTLGRGYHIIKLNKDLVQNADLVVKLRIFENMSYPWIDFFKFTSSNNIWHEILINNAFGIVTGIFLFSLGAFGNVFYSILLLITRKNNLHLLYSFAAIFFIGLWNCTTSGIIQLITGDYELISFFEYFSIYAAFVMYLFLIGVIKKQSSNAKIVDATKLVSLLFLIIATLIHVLGILCISKTIMFFRNYALVVMLILFYVIYKDVKSQKQYGRIFAVGSSLSFVLIILYIIIHNFQLMQLREITNDNFITLAILVMVILPLLLYILKLDAIGDYEAQIKVLKSLAYVDKLTGLGNRTSGRAYVMDLIKNELDYYIVMFDLNN